MASGDGGERVGRAGVAHAADERHHARHHHRIGQGRPQDHSGTCALVYRICEIASPTNCDQARVTIDLSGK